MRFMLATLCLLFASPALAAEPNEAATENGRYAMTPVQDGFLRLDTRSGAVSLCKVTGANVACRASAEESRALNEEIDRLSRENATLKAAAPNAQAGSKYGIPSDEEIDKALNVGEKFMKRMLRILRDDQAPDKT